MISHTNAELAWTPSSSGENLEGQQRVQTDCSCFSSTTSAQDSPSRVKMLAFAFYRYNKISLVQYFSKKTFEEWCTTLESSHIQYISVFFLVLSTYFACRVPVQPPGRTWWRPWQEYRDQERLRQSGEPQGCSAGSSPPSSTVQHKNRLRSN